MQPTQALGFAHFLAQTDAVGRTIIVILVAMSIASWYLIVVKTLQKLMTRHRTARFLATFWTRSLRRVIDEETARLEWGLTVLASVGSTAPFVGLFGTVWGVYHALVNIGMSGQGTLDKVSGPVGEALIMTGAGLAVAIPAVLAYNAFVRSNRVVLGKLDAFAHDLFAFLATGAHCAENGASDARRPVTTALKGAA